MTPFASLVGQEQAIELLTQAVNQNRVAPAYLFAGSPGIGRSLAARCFIELLFSKTPEKPFNKSELALLQRRIHEGNHPDLLWVEPTYLHQGKRLSAKEATEAGLKRKAPPQIRLEQVREISQFLSRPPLEAPRSIVVLEQAETMAESAANGLLKTLEEPGKATLILIAPSADSLLPTLVSRCQRIPFLRLNKKSMSQVLGNLGHGEIFSNAEILAMAQGSPGAAIAAWQQLQSITPALVERVKKPIHTLREALELAKEIDKSLDTETQFWLVDYLQHYYWQRHQQASAMDIIKHLEKARQHLLSYVQPRLVWECTLMTLIKPNLS